MTRKEIILFLVIAFISGAGWVFVPSQVATVPPLFSISYRFILSSIILLTICAIRKERLFDKSIFILVLFQGTLMFPLNYFLTYSACKYLTSGLVGLISSMVIVPSYVMGLLTHKYKLKFYMILALGCAILGLMALSRDAFITHSYSALGFVLAVLSIVASAIGLSVVPFIKKRTEVSIYVLTGQSMLVGGIVSLILGGLQFQSLEYSLETTYITNLLILSILTPIVFVSFYFFSNKYGAVTASYIWVIAPIFSLLMSVFVEKYMPTALELVGIMIIIFSTLYINFCLLRQNNIKERVGSKNATVKK
jgi:drug/metabolite transporter (DMT)-like permease